MSDRMNPIPFARLMDWALGEYRETQSLFGVEKLHRAAGAGQTLFGERLELPLGPAAGPHTQLCQNIIAAYAGGSRFFELKTVQTLDGEDLPVSKPCITAADECYNCEWSTELRVPEAFEEYVKGWWALKLLSKALGLGQSDGFIFNLSVGYDLEGIRSEKIDSFIEGLKDASKTPIWAECRDWALQNLTRLPGLTKADIEAVSPQVCRSATLSTLHGCPPAEIERIAAYLLTEKGLHTFIKCNPTLLGYEFARSTLDGLGFDYIAFDDHHFTHDLQYADALPMLRRLQALADEQKLSFGVKLTNTFPVKVAAGELPSEEMYMSGRSLFPLTIALAQKLSHDFDGKLRISYSGGADLGNIAQLVGCGIWPVTLATTLLKPGGYERLEQMARALERGGWGPFAGIDLTRLDALANEARTDKRYQKPVKATVHRKLPGKPALESCFDAPCRGGCPIGQDIPAYLRLAGEGKMLDALNVIVERNPLPFITGTICPHRCGEGCTRAFYESPVEVRQVKLQCAETAHDALLATLVPPERRGAPVAVVGGGPAGMASAFFLARAGRPVVLFERELALGGAVRRVIPAFRIGDEAIDCDVALLEAVGATLCTGRAIDSLEALWAEGFSDIVLAVGADRPGELSLEQGGAINALELLERLKQQDKTLVLGRRVAVVGGGNTAMDAARAALRADGVEEVTLVYRRDRRNMPADLEELELAEAEGVRFCALLAPISHQNDQLTCRRMVLGGPNASGRRTPQPTDELVTLPVDTVVAAVGEQVDGGFYAKLGLACDKKGYPVVDESLRASLPGVYVVGDGRRGPATVVEAIADAAVAAGDIAGTDVERYAALNAAGNPALARARRGLLCLDDSCSETERCLDCATLCGVCAEVCPNRANVVVGGQVLHLDGMCNECGNCATFCPHDGAPYRDKFTLFQSAEDFANSKNNGALPLGGLEFLLRLPDGPADGKRCDLTAGDGPLTHALAAALRRVLHRTPWLLGTMQGAKKVGV